MYKLLTKQKIVGSLVGFFALTLALLCSMQMFQNQVAVAVSVSARKLPIYSVETDKKVVALGINCAWDADDIPLLVEILEEVGAKATFFVVGEWAEKYPEATRSLYEAGHEVQSHSMTHPDMTTLSREAIVEELEQSARAIAAITGESPTLFRAPSGAYNDLVIATAEELGYYVIQWDADSIDWKNPTPAEMLSRVVNKAQPGSITLFHAGAENTPEALPAILEALKGQGYGFARVSDLIYKQNYEIDHAGRQRSTGPQEVVGEPVKRPQWQAVR